MKKTRIALGLILIAGILAFLLSWPNKLSRYPEIPTTIPNNIYDKEFPTKPTRFKTYPPNIDKKVSSLYAESKKITSTLMTFHLTRYTDQLEKIT
ncbi:hypothetical protein SAMN05660461_2813 [Chitinophaga ginsengisegetis]|uniref:Uncharacterized protein n=1 Tax=Chitinophaga ginsengisegetis TaxID=393003 RepID=A0A1T5NVB9_9BACT|nr:hypothetical protein [Chitinophaga ginsengisegetis]SKD04317.1 hypothetical protein SAMN05660461_2813 [Chitinophaga ginsengisegetis]